MSKNIQTVERTVKEAKILMLLGSLGIILVPVSLFMGSGAFAIFFLVAGTVSWIAGRVMKFWFND